MSDVKEKPIIFSGAMVKAILDGKKVQTRRVIKPQPQWIEQYQIWACKSGDGGTAHDIARDLVSLCPYGQAGSRLWVRETFGYYNTGHFDRENMGVYYKATDSPGDLVKRWRPSIHMPRQQSRLTLEICEVRVQRVQDISEQDAVAEGCSAKEYIITPGEFNPSTRRFEMTAKEDFESLWNCINAKRGFSWDMNCWVWAITFRRVEVTGNDQR